eukprot:s159_g28.t1
MLHSFTCIRCIFLALIRRVCLSCTFWHHPNITGTPSLLMAQCHKKSGIMDALGPPNMKIFLIFFLEKMPLVLLVLQIVGKSLLIRNASLGNHAIPEFTSWAVSPALLTLRPAEVKWHTSFVVETANVNIRQSIIVFRVKVVLISSGLVEAAKSMDLPRKAPNFCRQAITINASPIPS